MIELGLLCGSESSRSGVHRILLSFCDCQGSESSSSLVCPWCIQSESCLAVCSVHLVRDDLGWMYKNSISASMLEKVGSGWKKKFALGRSSRIGSVKPLRSIQYNETKMSALFSHFR